MIYAGIDEAGYGPVLGPLCVGCAVLEIDNWREGEAAPDVWKLLKAAVCREPGKAKTRIAVNDSKKLKGSNSLKTRHPLMHLERGVLAFLSRCTSAEAEQVTCDGSLLRALGVSLDGLDWYGGNPTPLPLSTTADHQGLMNVQLGAACESAGVKIRELRCFAMTETEFNARIARVVPTDQLPSRDERSESKAAVSFSIVAGFLRRVWKSDAAKNIGESGPPRVAVDRQGGRAAYKAILERAFPDAIVRILGESPTKSAYELEGLGESDGRRMRVSFQVEADAAHFPVALASMTAKLVRELAMARFNRYWGQRIAELKPTAGYALDGERWLNDARPHLTPDEVRTLRRMA